MGPQHGHGAFRLILFTTTEIYLGKSQIRPPVDTRILTLDGHLYLCLFYPVTMAPVFKLLISCFGFEKHNAVVKCFKNAQDNNCIKNTQINLSIYCSYKTVSDARHLSYDH